LHAVSFFWRATAGMRSRERRRVGAITGANDRSIARRVAFPRIERSRASTRYRVVWVLPWPFFFQRSSGAMSGW
jgi:hypothetical protein